MEPTVASATPTSVYLYYDAAGILIYVGVTSRGIKRNHEHNESKDWWQYVARQEVEHFDTRTAALAREKAIIRTNTPPFNTQHNPAHRSVRDVYLRFALAQSGDPVDLRSALKRMQHRVELNVHAWGELNHMAFRTRIDDAAIVAALDWPPPKGEAPRVFGGKPKGFARIQRVEKVGPIAVIHLGTQQWHPLLNAYAIVKFTTAQRLTIRNIHVRLDHSDGRQCTSRCPRPPRVRWIRPDGEGAA